MEILSFDIAQSAHHRVVDGAVLSPDYPGSCFLQKFIRIKHMGDQATINAEFRKECSCVNSARFRPAVYFVVVSVENVVDRLYRGIRLTRIEKLQVLKLFRNRCVIEQWKQPSLQSRINKSFHKLQRKCDAVRVAVVDIVLYHADRLRVVTQRKQ